MNTTSRATDGTPPSSRGAQILLQIHAILKDGEWHSWEQVVKAVAPKLHRPAAGRVGENDRVRQQRRMGCSPRRRTQPTESTVLSGARSLMAQAVRSSDRWFEKRGERRQKEIRMKATPTHLLPYVDDDDVLPGDTCPACHQRLPVG